MLAIETTGLEKRYSDPKAMDNLKVNKGGVYGLLAPAAISLRKKA